MQQRRRLSQRGMTLVEVLVSTALLVGGGGALLMGMCQGIIFTDDLSDQQVAMNFSRGKLEELTTTPFDTLWTGADFAAARAATGQRICMGEDANCNGVLDGAEVDLNNNGLVDQLLVQMVGGVPTSGNLTLQIYPYPRTLAGGIPNANPSMLDLHLAAAWRSGRRCIGGEDRGCNGRVDAGEDVNGDGWVEAPVMVSTRIARRD